MVDRQKYRRVPELYTDGVELPLKDDLAVYIKALNPYEQQEARQDAQVARARIVMALHQQESTELSKVKSTFLVDGRESAIDRIIDNRSSEALIKATEEVANDPDWKERLEIASRSEEIIAKPIGDSERDLLDTINRDYLLIVNRKMDEELVYQRSQLIEFTDERLVDEYVKLYIDNQGTESAMAEHSLTQIWYSVRACDGIVEDGVWNHTACDGHRVQVYETKAEVRDLPESLQDLYSEALQALNLTVREAKNSDRQGSSSDSSPLPSEAGDSVPSIPMATLVSVPGI